MVQVGGEDSALPKASLWGMYLEFYGEFQECFIPQGGVRPTLIVIAPPAFDLNSGIDQRQEPIGLEALLSESGLE